MIVNLLLILHLLHLMHSNHVPVVGYAIINNYEIISANTLSINPNIKVNKETLFQACSISKSVTAFAILQLTAQHKIHLSQSVNSQLIHWQIPNSRFSHVVLVKQCLAMTSGLRYGKSGAGLRQPYYKPNMPLPNSLKTILNGKAPAINYPVQTSFQPGSQYAYSGACYMVLAELLEDKVHRDFASYMKDSVLNKLHMEHSGFYAILPTSLRHFAVPGFNQSGQQLPGGWYNNPNLAAGGLWSTPIDIAHFLLELTNLPARTQKLMLQRQPHSIFGLGFVVDGKGKALNIRKVGYNQGYYNQLIYFPYLGKGLVIMTDSASGKIVRPFIAYVAKRYHWPVYSTEFAEIFK